MRERERIVQLLNFRSIILKSGLGNIKNALDDEHIFEKTTWTDWGGVGPIPGPVPPEPLDPSPVSTSSTTHLFL